MTQEHDVSGHVERAVRIAPDREELSVTSYNEYGDPVSRITRGMRSVGTASEPIDYLETIDSYRYDSHWN
jgi:hypothetical protein